MNMYTYNTHEFTKTREKVLITHESICVLKRIKYK